MNSDALRILIVDDSRIFRAAVEAALEGQPKVKVVGSVWSGEKAIEFLQAQRVDLVSLDVNMPGRGGLDTLGDIQQLNAARQDTPPVGVILVSALTDRGAAVTVEGLARGAFDFIRKPDGPDERANAASLRQQLLEKIELFAQRRRRSDGRTPASSSASPPRVSEPSSRLPAPPAPPRSGRYQAIAIGSSTGGPEALARILPDLTARTSLPVFIVQHFPQGMMTRFFAESLARRCSHRVVEASDGEPVQPGTVYIAPWGRHMVLRRQAGRVQVALNDLPPENGFRPSVDVFFRSVADAYPQSALAIVLTGMGTDGAKGLGPLKRAGAYLIAQDEASSVVWGMPGAAAATNLVDAILPLDRIAPTVIGLLGSGSTS